MSAVTFVLKTDLRQRLDVSPLSPGSLSGRTAEQIAQEVLQYGNRKVAVAELFDIRVSPGGASVIFQCGSDKFDFVGRGMIEGEIVIQGDAGAYLGHQMKGGTIRITGDAGLLCASEMSGGQIIVNGSAGDFLGAALPGNRKGMAGGAVIVRGSVGARAGDHMRRGVILIEGDAGPYLGSRMVAGTIAVRGRVGDHPGYGMKRGTLLLCSAPEKLPPTFNDCGSHTLGFLPLLLKSFGALESAVFADVGSLPGRVRRYAGDLAVMGKGEILVAL